MADPGSGNLYVPLAYRPDEPESREKLALVTSPSEAFD